MKRDVKKDEPKAVKQGVCSPLPDSLDERVKNRKMIQVWKIAWRKDQWDSQMENPNLRSALQKVASYRINPLLLNYGVDIQLLNFPAGALPQDAVNFPQIIRAFSRTFGPNLFEELSLTDPFPSGEPYWSSPPLQLTIQYTGRPLGCIGNPGNYQPGSGQTGGIMTLVDCADEDVIFHEIGHAVMDDGILKNKKPLYFHYGTGGAAPAGGPPPTIDSKMWLNDWFGKTLDSKIDTDGVPFGFVSDYAAAKTNRTAVRNKAEDFAETFMHYVYYPSNMFERIYRQSAAGSNTLSKKAGLISQLYAGMTFNDWGVPAEWLGYLI